MNLRRVTISGADDTVDAKQVYKLATKFPFVEWGLLFSRDRMGLSPRYPSLKWLAEFSEFKNIHRSVHLCGAWARHAINSSHPLHLMGIDGMFWLCGDVERVQLNISPYLKDGLEHGGLDCWVAEARQRDLKVIIQAKNFSHPLASFVAKTTGVCTLHDASGGNGLYGAFEAPTDQKQIVGFAGGITPENCVATADTIEAFPESCDYWLDLETGARDADDKFCLDRVEDVLNKLKTRVVTTRK